jgi:hypothetical protein
VPFSTSFSVHISDALPFTSIRSITRGWGQMRVSALGHLSDKLVYPQRLWSGGSCTTPGVVSHPPDPEPRMTVLARASSNLSDPTQQRLWSHSAPLRWILGALPQWQ